MVIKMNHELMLTQCTTFEWFFVLGIWADRSIIFNGSVQVPHACAWFMHTFFLNHISIRLLHILRAPVFLGFSWFCVLFFECVFVFVSYVRFCFQYERCLWVDFCWLLLLLVVFNLFYSCTCKRLWCHCIALFLTC